jgi:hypothetical protein
MTVEQPVNEVQIPGPATACADREVAGNFGIRPGGKRRDLLVAHGHPLDVTVLAQRIGYAVQGIADQPVHTGYAGGAQDFNESIGHAGHDGKVSYCVGDELSALGSLQEGHRRGLQDIVAAPIVLDDRADSCSTLPI